MIKRKNFLSKPEHLLMVLSSSAVWLFLSLSSQPLTYHGPDSQHRKAPLEASCPSCSLRAGLAGRASAPASASCWNMAIETPTSLLFCLGLWQMNLLKSCVFPSASLYTWKYCLFSVSCLLFGPSWWTSWLHNYAEWSQKGCAVFGLFEGSSSCLRPRCSSAWRI